ncbi:MAG: hypothetical protein K6A69_00355 [Lachnospiraceae bacterium]|nr:hypothetical protein [Lachnospiraceae bacterium]
MSVESITTSTVAAQYSTVDTKNAKKASDEVAKKGAFSDEAAVYEKSKDSVSAKNSAVDHSAIVAQMKADSEARMQSMVDLVKQTLQGQGNTLAKADDVWKFLASGEFKNVDEAAVAQAKKDIAEDGYWGVDQTSSRIVDFAIALSGNDPDKADKLLSAFEKGYKEATKTWGKELPDISKRTYDAVHDKFDQWKEGTYQSDVVEQ